MPAKAKGLDRAQRAAHTTPTPAVAKAAANKRNESTAEAADQAPRPVTGVAPKAKGIMPCLICLADTLSHEGGVSRRRKLFSRASPKNGAKAGSITLTDLGKQMAENLQYTDDHFVQHLDDHPATENQVFLCNLCGNNTEKFLLSLETCRSFLKTHGDRLPLKDVDLTDLGLPLEKKRKSPALVEGKVSISSSLLEYCKHFICLCVI